jgi:hypothetical protein
MNKHAASSETHVDVARRLGAHPHAVLDQDSPHPVHEVGEKQRMHHLQTNIIALKHPPRPGPQRCRITTNASDMSRNRSR